MRFQAGAVVRGRGLIAGVNPPLPGSGSAQVHFFSAVICFSSFLIFGAITYEQYPAFGFRR